MAEAVLPYVVSTGALTKALEKIQKAATPERFTQDFLASKLGLKGGSAKPVIPFLKRTGLLASDGVPTALYSKFRNAKTRGAAAAEALSIGYAPLFEADENAHDLPDDELRGLVVQIAGVDDESRVLSAIVGSFKALREHADFEGIDEADVDESEEAESDEAEDGGGASNEVATPPVLQLPTGLNLGYTINLHPAGDVRHRGVQRHLQVPEGQPAAIGRAMRSAEDALKLFAVANQLVEHDLDRVEKDFGIDLRRTHTRFIETDEDYYPQIEQAFRAEAAAMAPHYEVFYSLEKTIRRLISDTLEAAEGSDWWTSTRVLPDLQKEVAKRQKREIDSGTTPRSNDPIDFTTFGELGELIKSNWDVFGALFSSVRAVERVMGSLNTLRGPIAHCAPLADDEVLRLQLAVRDWFRLME